MPQHLEPLKSAPAAPSSVLVARVGNSLQFVYDEGRNPESATRQSGSGQVENPSINSGRGIQEEGLVIGIEPVRSHWRPGTEPDRCQQLVGTRREDRGTESCDQEDHQPRQWPSHLGRQQNHNRQAEDEADCQAEADAEGSGEEFRPADPRPERRRRRVERSAEQAAERTAKHVTQSGPNRGTDNRRAFTDAGADHEAGGRRGQRDQEPGRLDHHATTPLPASPLWEERG